MVVSGIIVSLLIEQALRKYASINWLQMFGIVSFCCFYWNWTCLVTWELFDEIEQKLGLLTYVTNMVYVRELNKDFETTCIFFLPLETQFPDVLPLPFKTKVLNFPLISLLTYVLTWLEAVSILLFHLYNFRRSLMYVEVRFGVQESRKMFFSGWYWH